MSDTYKSYLIAVLYFTTAWSIAGFASIATFIYYKEYFYEE
ncbi:TPA: DUF1270 family protein [Staphylococcus aureus]|nr:DUF1270 family protein [Staphylococcus aureus]